jgi:PPOX class probable F420-dependent enzyme
MSAAIPERLAGLLRRETKAFAFLALVKSDGTPQVTPIWFDYDGENLIFNTARGRVKDRILHRHPVVAAVIVDTANPYEYLQISGRVVEETEVGGHAVIMDLNEKYHGVREYALTPGMVRVTYKVSIDHVQPDK